MFLQQPQSYDRVISHSAETSGPSDSATESYWCSCSVFTEKLGDQVLFQYVSSSAVPDIPSPSDLLIKEVLSCWGSFSLSISLGWPLVSAAFHHFTISSHCSLLLWKSWECSPVASSHPSCQACSGLPAVLLWRAKIEWNQSSVGTNWPCFTLHEVLLFLHTYFSLMTLHPTTSVLFFSILFCNCSTPQYSSFST